MSATAELTIDPATLVVTPDAQNRTYGQAVPTYTFSVTGFVNSEDETAAGYTDPSCTSDYAPTTPVADSPLTITCSGGSADNYVFDVSATAELTIDPATLVVTPDAQNRTYGQAVPTYTFSVTGFVNSEDETAACHTGPSRTSDYAPTTPVTDSPPTITCSGGTADNYVFDVSARPS